MKTTLLIIAAVIILVIMVIIGLRFLTPEDDWICQNGQWVKHGNPTAEMPSKSCK